MSKEIWNSVVLGEYKHYKAKLYEFSKKELKGRVYPGLTKSKKSVVEGVLYLDVTKQDIKRLDKFEGEEYERIKVTIQKDSDKIEAFTYLYKDEYFNNVLEIEWSYEDFLQNELVDFQNKYKGWDKI